MSPNVGLFTRLFSIYEFRQLINMIKGEISPPIPRAYLSSERNEMELYAEMILSINPGITVRWQVLRLYDTSLQKQMKMEAYLVNNQSIRMDAYIYLRLSMCGFWEGIAKSL